MLTEFAGILLSGFLLNNIVLVQLLGVSPPLAYQTREDAAMAIGMVTSLVLILATLINYGIYHLLLMPLQLDYLASIVFLLIIAGLVQLAQTLLTVKTEPLSRAAGIYILLIISNCAVLGLSLNAIIENASFIQTIAASLGAALGFCLVLALFCCLQERIACANLPKAFQGAPINLITLGLMALAFMGFTGMHAG